MRAPSHLLRAAVAALALTLLSVSVAWAAPPASQGLAVCPVDAPKLDRFTFMRALSLDLRGNIPTVGELEALEGKADVPEATIDAWLQSPEFATQAVRRHRDLLWNSIVNVRAPLNPTYLRRTGTLYWRGGGNVAIYVRGDRVPCNNKPATWDADGQIVFEQMPDGTKREGYVMVAPYWSPKTKLKVCAHDAQAMLVSPTGKTCGQYGTYYDPYCGCGPNLRWCHYGSSNTDLMRSFAESLERSVAEIIAEDRPYTDLFTHKTMWVNGPIVFFYKHQLWQTRVRMDPAPLDVATLPALSYTDRHKWVKIQLGKEHAGLLTHPAYLLRYQTNRARGSRFYETFLCQPFTAPADGIDVAGVAAVSEPDLQKRGGCKYCHGLLEPVAAFWGRWVESGAGFLDPKTYPEFRADCETCAKTGQLCSTACKRYYMTKALSEPEKAFYGMLSAFVFRRPEHKHHVAHGPRLMALAAVADNRLPRCVARSTASWLLGRELTSDEEPWADELGLDFVKNGFSFRSLVRDVVTSDTYRRVR